MEEDTEEVESGWAVSGVGRLDSWLTMPLYEAECLVAAIFVTDDGGGGAGADDAGDDMGAVVVAAAKMMGDPTGEGEEDVMLEEGEDDDEGAMGVGLMVANVDDMECHFVAGFGILI